MNQKEQQIINCTKISDIPKDMHYAILIEDTVYEHDSYGNDSISNYSSRSILHYKAFKKKADWEKEITEMTLYSGYSKKVFLPIMVNVAKLETKITVTVTE